MSRAGDNSVAALAGTQRFAEIRQFDFGHEHVCRITNLGARPNTGQCAADRFAQPTVEAQLDRFADRDVPIIGGRNRDLDTQLIERCDLEQHLTGFHRSRREFLQTAAEHDSVQWRFQFQQTLAAAQQFELCVELFDLQSREFRLAEIAARRPM